ncbi:DUF2917 domain-containing protein [Geomonas subterranea]|uniref:DUF2917 domain-containing protein n=1 Tax=Geomonas subterranea TaxID=2847989 RepID=A0ABX8LGF3_9BACT|nr:MULTISPECIES: DUF2917 domain-containing protein [Geomonas]QXE90752.1 DUF2917 domain-containing protein [Geomonas subterranea]QXM11166.1 DUF2917 domain-containing protein [Geomonas subterranea]
MECLLGKGELLNLAGGAYGLTLRCLTGTIWLTKGDGRDYLVRQGSSFELSKGEPALAEALETAELQMRSAGVAEQRGAALAAAPAGPFLPRPL